MHDEKEFKLYYTYNIIIVLAAEVPYNITVKAVNLAGYGEEEQVYCFTQEGGNYKLHNYVWI